MDVSPWSGRAVLGPGKWTWGRKGSRDGLTGQGGCSGQCETALGHSRAPDVPSSRGTREMPVLRFQAAGSESSQHRAALTTENQPCLGRTSAPARAGDPQSLSSARAPGMGSSAPGPGPGRLQGREGASSGSTTASLVLPQRQLELPEPARQPRGKADSEQQPKNSCPGHTQSPERRGSEKEDGLQLSKEQPPAPLTIHG